MHVSAANQKISMKCVGHGMFLLIDETFYICFEMGLNEGVMLLKCLISMPEPRWPVVYDRLSLFFQSNKHWIIPSIR